MSHNPYPYELYRGFPPHVDQDTSRAAAASQIHKANSKRAEVFRLIKSKGILGATDNEMELALGWRHQTLSARRRELVLLNKIEDSGQRRKTDSGRSAIVWVELCE